MSNIIARVRLYNRLSLPFHSVYCIDGRDFHLIHRDLFIPMGHGWRSSPTAWGSHLRALALWGLEHSSHRPAPFAILQYKKIQFEIFKCYCPYDRSRSLDIELPVDPDSMYTWVRRERLEELGIRPMTRWKFRTINRMVIERDIGKVIIECMNERATTIIVFAEKGDAEVLGTYALEGLRLEVDPITKQLRKVEAVLAL